MVQCYCDEAGRGSLIGKIFAVAVLLESQDDFTQVVSSYNQNKKRFQQIVVRDSKKMSERQRNNSRLFLQEHVKFGVGTCDENEIDSMGITPCNVMAMHRAIDNVLEKYPTTQLEKINVDGILFKPYRDVPYRLIIKGDSTDIGISAASILAKTLRDEYILQMCSQYPELEKYDITHNKGYGTKKHTDAIRMYGTHPIHRKTFITHFTTPVLRFL